MIKVTMIRYGAYKAVSEKDNGYGITPKLAMDALNKSDDHIVYDMASFLFAYKDIIGMTGLQRITGINAKQLHHYMTGISKPTAKTQQRFIEAVRAFADTLLAVKLH